MPRIALVTGASSGIGRSLVKKLAALGYQTIGVARNQSFLQEIVAELGEKHTYLQLDLTDTNDLHNLKDYLRTQRVNLLVNNAGIGMYGEFADSGDISAMLQLNITAVVELSRTFLQSAQPGDALLNVSSVVGYVPCPYACGYAATKAFVSSFTESLWYEYRNRGVYIMNLCPGATATNFHRAAGQKKPQTTVMQSPEQVAEIAVSALQQRKSPTVFTSFSGKMLFFLSKILSRKFLLKVAGRGMQRWSTY